MKFSVILGPITQNLGAFKVPMLLLLAMVCIVIIMLLYETFVKKEVNPERRRQGLNALLILGSMSLIVGMFGQIMGIWYALAAIIAAADISPAIIIEGLQASFGTTFFGFIIFMIALVAWLIINYLPKRKVVV